MIYICYCCLLCVRLVFLYWFCVFILQSLLRPSSWVCWCRGGPCAMWWRPNCWWLVWSATILRQRCDHWSATIAQTPSTSTPWSSEGWRKVMLAKDSCATISFLQPWDQGEDWIKHCRYFTPLIGAIQSLNSEMKIYYFSNLIFQTISLISAIKHFTLFRLESIFGCQGERPSPIHKVDTTVTPMWQEAKVGLGGQAEWHCTRR